MERMTCCRACKRTNLFMSLPLGDHPPANGFLRADQLAQPEARFPLNTHVCLDCGLIQVPDNVPPNFFRNYVYVPSGATTMFTHFESFAEKMVREYASGGDDLIIDIGCNNGLFLGYCKEKGARVLGIDPADNLTELPAKKGIDIVGEYFGSKTGKMVAQKYPGAAVIVTTNTLNHIDDLHDFMRGITLVLSQQGIFVVEVPQAVDLIEKNEFDTIYHEHVSEFSVRSLMELYRFFELEVFKIEKLPIHGGSMRVYAQRQGGPRPIDPVVSEWLRREEEAGLLSKETHIAFAKRVEKIRAELLALLADLRSQGKTIAGYGAPAKGNTLLNYYKIGPDTLPFLVDRNELKHGLYSPGMHIPVVAPSRILETQPDYLLLLAWNFADEIIEQQSEYRKRGGKFILPIPKPKIIE
jgi:SAM-dependent methyltransferase